LQGEPDPTLKDFHTSEREALLRVHTHEGWHLKAWFEANAEREACHPEPRLLDKVCRWLKNNDLVKGRIEGGGPARRGGNPTLPPKRRAQKLQKEFERLKRDMATRQEHEAAAVTVMQCWRESGCATAEVGTSLDATVEGYTPGDESNPKGKVLIPDERTWHRMEFPLGYNAVAPE